MTSPFQKMLKDWQSKKAKQAIDRHTRLLINIGYLLFNSIIFKIVSTAWFITFVDTYS